jgi:hypothetical protein
MSTFSQQKKTTLLGLAAVFGGIMFLVFLSMGYSMWKMKHYMSHMSDYMKEMNGSMGSMVGMSDNMNVMSEDMTGMSSDMREMRIAMVNMGGTPDQVAAIRPKKPAGNERGAESTDGSREASVPEMKAVYDTCNEFLASVGSERGLLNAAVDSVKEATIETESYMASIKRDMGEMDAHMFCMYLSMSADMAAMRQSMSIMTPSVATMGPTMNYMGHDMNRGVNSFTSPMNYMFNAFR